MDGNEVVPVEVNDASRRFSAVGAVKNETSDPKGTMGLNSCDFDDP
jgi:hypothetical protein